MSDKKRSYLYWLSLTGALIALVSFFLPWVKVGFVVGHKTVTGLGLAEKDARLWILPVSALIIVFLSPLCIKKPAVFFRILMVLSGSLGLSVTAFTFITIKHELNRFFIKLITNYHIEPGIFAVFAGFLIILISMLIPVGRPDTTNDMDINQT